MINNNNNFYGIDSMSASVYYGDGSNLTGISGGGGGSASATMFNSVIAPMVIAGGASPWYKLNTPALSYAGTGYVLATPDQISYSVINLVEGETINEVAIFCSTLLAAATASIALYSIDLDANGRHYPSTLLTTFGEVSLATTGRKTITGLSYSIPASLNGIYYTAILRTGAAGSPAIAGPTNTITIGYYGALDNLTLQSRSMTIRTGGSNFTFPSTITSASFSTYNPITSLPYIGFR